MQAAIKGKEKAMSKYGISILSKDLFNTIEAQTEKVIIVVQIMEDRSKVTLSTPQNMQNEDGCDRSAF